MIRRVAWSVIAAGVSMVLLTTPAVAASGTAHCGGYGLGTTGTGSSVVKTQKFASSTVVRAGQVQHGWYSGSHPWSVTPGDGYGICPS